MQQRVRDARRGANERRQEAARGECAGRAAWGRGSPGGSAGRGEWPRRGRWRHGGRQTSRGGPRREGRPSPGRSGAKRSIKHKKQTQVQIFYAPTNTRNMPIMTITSRQQSSPAQCWCRTPKGPGDRKPTGRQRSRSECEFQTLNKNCIKGLVAERNHQDLSHMSRI